MLKAIRVPLLFLFIGSLLGVFLRWQFIVPTSGTNYSYFLHGHSHVMFLGWIFNIVFIAFVSNYIPSDHQKLYWKLFIVLQTFVVCMLFSFPLQGYGFYSILFSTLHTLVAIGFIIKFFQHTRFVTSTSSWFAKIALTFFLISTIGPFSLGYLMASGLGQSNWYYFSIYFYLHFQYNGFFLFGVLSLFFEVLEKEKISFNVNMTRRSGMILAVSCIPAYLLSVLWAKPGYVFNLIGGASALFQLVGLAYLIKLIVMVKADIKRNLKMFSVTLFLIAFAAFALKLFLQLFSSLPSVAELAYELRPIVIAYLHLVLIGLVSTSLFAWFLQHNLIDYPHGKRIMYLFLFSFVGMEVCLVLSPWWTSLFGETILSATTAIFIFSITLSISFGLLLTIVKPDRNQLLA